MNWLAVFTVVCVGWLWLHLWLGKNERRRFLAFLVVADILGFAALYLWISESARNPSAGGAAALFVFFGILLFIIPAIGGAYALWRHPRRTQSEA